MYCYISICHLPGGDKTGKEKNPTDLEPFVREVFFRYLVMALDFFSHCTIYDSLLLLLIRL